MPRRAASPCTTPGCPELAPCPTHTRKAWAGMGHGARLRKSGWERQRDNERILRRDRRRCRRCGAPATVVDHVVNLAAGGADVDSNKQALCSACHDAKSKLERTDGRRPDNPAGPR